MSEIQIEYIKIIRLNINNNIVADNQLAMVLYNLVI